MASAVRRKDICEATHALAVTLTRYTQQLEYFSIMRLVRAASATPPPPLNRPRYLPRPLRLATLPLDAITSGLPIGDIDCTDGDGFAASVGIDSSCTSGGWPPRRAALSWHSSPFSFSSSPQLSSSLASLASASSGATAAAVPPPGPPQRLRPAKSTAGRSAPSSSGAASTCAPLPSPRTLATSPPDAAPATDVAEGGRCRVPTEREADGGQETDLAIGSSSVPPPIDDDYREDFAEARPAPFTARPGDIPLLQSPGLPELPRYDDESADSESPPRGGLSGNDVFGLPPLVRATSPPAVAIPMGAVEHAPSSTPILGGNGISALLRQQQKRISAQRTDHAGGQPHNSLSLSCSRSDLVNCHALNPSETPPPTTPQFEGQPPQPPPFARPGLPPRPRRAPPF